MTHKRLRDVGKYFCVFTPYKRGKVVHEARVAAAVARHRTIGDVQVDFLGVAEEVVQGQMGQIHVALHTAAGAHHLDGAVAPFGKGGHGKVDGGPIVQIDVHHLVIHHIVVAAIYAAAVRPFPQRF